MPQESEYAKAITEQFESLPQVVRNAILSADVETRLRGFWTKHQLHLDQWGILQNEVMLALLGIKPVEDLSKNIREHVNVPESTATSLASEISAEIFEPIRQELERQLEHPEAKEKTLSGVETKRAEELAKVSADSAPSPAEPVAPGVAPATPPAPPNTQKAVRMPASGAYKPGEASTTRKDIHDDPYREPPA